MGTSYEPLESEAASNEWMESKVASEEWLEYEDVKFDVSASDVYHLVEV